MTATLDNSLKSSCFQFIVAFEDTDISQGSVVTHLRYGGIFSDSNYNKFCPDSDSEIILEIG